MKKLLLALSLLICLCLCISALGQEQVSYATWRLGVSETPPGVTPLSVPLDAAVAQDMPGFELLPDGSLSTGGQGSVLFEVDVPEEALYEIQVEYMPGSGGGSDIQRSVLINGCLPFMEAEGLVFHRLWNDANRDYQTVEGNQPFPSQVEVPAFRTVRLSDPLGYVVRPFLFQFKQGVNSIIFQSIQDGMIIKSLQLMPPEKLPDYQDYLQTALQAGLNYSQTAPVQIEAEEAAVKSSPSLYPLNDRTSPKTTPYHPSYIVLNSIGGSAWNTPGDFIAWDIEAPEEGLYRIGLRFKQSTLRGMYAARSLRINGQVPFSEAEELRFYHGNGFQFGVLGDDKTTEGGYWFHLQKGVNRIELAVALGDLGDVLSQIDDATADLNSLYRDIIAITGTAPDVNRNYQLFLRVPGLQDNLIQMKERLTQIHEALSALIGEGNERAAGLTRLLSLMDDLIEGEEQVVKNLSSFKESITSMGKSVLDLKDSPMVLDWLMLLGKDTPEVDVSGSFGDKVNHSIGAFLGSFTNDYNVSDQKQTDSDQPVIDVWVSSGRDQFQVIRRLINESFTPLTGIRVNLRLIGTDVLLPATFTGTGPEVALQIGNTAPVNFAFRGAALDLMEFSDIDTVLEHFLPASLGSYRYEGGLYALPDQMSFPVLYYRKDILNQLGIDVPETWTDLIELIPELQKGNMEIYLDTNPPQTLGAAVSMGNARPVNTVFLSRLLQTGGQIYSPGGERCLFDSEEANLAFRWWTQFYTQHGFPRDIDFITRFRLGEVPLGIVDLSAYNALAVSAPEIRNQWSIAKVPGTELEDGTISHAVPCVTGASMIIKNIAEARGTKEASWEFLKWWTSQDTQSKYAREMEAILGPAGRYLVSNLESYRAASWPLDIKQTLMEVLDDLHGVPEVPGGYITGRYLNNAFLSVITAYENPSDVLFENVVQINDEIAAKRAEFGLTTDQAEGGEAQ